MAVRSTPIIPECFFQQHGNGCLFPENFHHVTPWPWILESLELPCLGKRCLQRYGWCDMAEEMVAIEDNVDL